MIPAARLSALEALSPRDLLGQKGLEKESLRITGEGHIAQTHHPPKLGPALTHPHITTDYSEALLELITPPEHDLDRLLAFLDLLHRAVYSVLPENELLLATSSPIGFESPDSIPIAWYGHSNLGLLKHVYRVGLDHRYGRAMQIIAGIHFNWSMSKELLSALKPTFPEFRELEERDFRSALYLGQVRNFFRLGWLLLYLFGASPAIDAAFIRCRRLALPPLKLLEAETFYAPYGTSLRMSEIGYWSPVQSRLVIDLNRLEGYIESLWRATRTPYPPYERIGIKRGERYRQLSTAILQIENEFYSPFRPKASPLGEERLLCRLAKEGIRYVEIRALDLNPFLPLGVDRSGIAFLELFALYALLLPSPPMSREELRQAEANLLKTAWEGRHPKCRLKRGGETVLLQQWALDTLEAMTPLAELLDRTQKEALYSTALQNARRLVLCPDETLSARLLEALRCSRRSFRAWALEQSFRHAVFFRQQGLTAGEQAWLEELRKLSETRARLLEEASRNVPFERFLAHYLKEPCHEA